MKWIKATELPPIDVADDWNKKGKISKNVLCWSKEWGMRFGRYFHAAEFWTVDGVTSPNGVNVEYYMEVTPPEQ